MSLKEKPSLALQWSVSDLGDFFRIHRRDFHSYASRILKDSGLAEEVVQEAFIRVILAAPELETQEHAISYFRKTIENLCLDIFRRDGRRPNLVVIDDALSEIEASNPIPDHETLISAADDAAIIRQALSMLSHSERAALVMWEIEGRSAEEISKELGIKKTSVRHTVSRARTSLRRILSELVIDENRGLTALDLLSTTYKKSTALAKNSSRAALSLILLVFSYLGFVNVFEMPQKPSTVNSANESSESGDSVVEVTNGSVSTAMLTPRPAAKKNSSSLVNAKATPLTFAGLDKAGVPIGFTITDSSDSLGSLYFVGRETVPNDAGLVLSSIAKTSKGAANILLNQTLTQDSSGLNYDAMISFGRKGTWIPTFTKVISVDSERLVSGNYLVTAVVQVKSEVETTIVIPASADGRDLEVSPSRVITRILLNPSKTQVLAQAVQVVEKISK